MSTSVLFKFLDAATKMPTLLQIRRDPSPAIGAVFSRGHLPHDFRREKIFQDYTREPTDGTRGST